MDDPTTRPRYSRNDLERLKKLDRAGIFEALGSFDDRPLSEDAFVVQAAALLSPEAVVGLAEARRRADAPAILDAILSACRAFCAEEAFKAEFAVHGTQVADDILAHRFSFYDEPHQLPEDIDWDFNPGTGHWSHDLNRFWYLHPLTAAFFGTQDGKYARKAVGFILDWIGKCDFAKAFVGTPYAFGSYLNQAIHCIEWVDCLQKLLPAGQVKPFDLLRILKSLHDHLAYLEIVSNGHSGNWPTIGCRGMLATLAAFPLFRDTDRFVGYCTAALGEQIDDQVLPDGVQDELTPHYHRCVVDNLLTALASVRKLGRDLEPRTLSVLRKMVHYEQQTVVPDGSAQVAFNDSDPAAVPDIATQLAEVGLQDFLSPPERLGSELFPYAGVAFLRQRQTEGDLYLAFDGGPYGRSHQHEDKLGFWLFAYGRSFLVDPGRHLYDHSKVSYLPHLRRTRAHSTVMIDGQGQHSAGRRDTWIPRAPSPVDWHVNGQEIRAAAAYDLGYGAENAIHVVHRREIVFVRERFWVIFDRVEGEGEHRVESRFQFAPCRLELDGKRAHTCFEDANLLLHALPEAAFRDIQVREGQEDPREGWYSSRYALIEPAPCVCFSATAPLPFFAATLLFPYRGAGVPPVSFGLKEGAVTVETEETGLLQVSSSLGS
jgi:hypothetical protein